MDKRVMAAEVRAEIERLTKVLALLEGDDVSSRQRGDLSPEGRETIRLAAMLRHERARGSHADKNKIKALELDLEKAKKASAEVKKQRADERLKHLSSR